MVKRLLTKHDESVAEIYIRNVPEAVRKALRQMALDQGLSMNALLLELLAKAVKPSK